MCERKRGEHRVARKPEQRALPFKNYGAGFPFVRILIVMHATIRRVRSITTTFENYPGSSTDRPTETAWAVHSSFRLG